MFGEIAPMLRHFIEDMPCLCFAVRARLLDQFSDAYVIE
jgi:hypothetical protein